MRLLLLLPLLVLTGCVELNPITTPENFDPKAVTRLSFVIEDVEDSQLKTFDSAELDGISREISERFSEAGYPVISGQEPIALSRQTSGSNNVSHLLQASVGATALTQMPVGFTLDFGHSTPRAPNFQKTTTVDIDCRLVDAFDKKTPILLRERKAIPARIANVTPDTPENFEKVRRYYVENIGATCHDLLDKLDIFPKEPQADKSEVESGTWRGMRIKTEYEDETPVKAGTPAAAPVRSAKPAARPPVSPPTREKLTETPTLETAPAVSVPETEKATPVRLAPEQKPLPKATVSDQRRPEEVSKIPPAQSVEAQPPTVPDTVPAAISTDQPPPVAMENGNVPAQTPEAEPEPGAPAISTEENKARDWRKKKITIFNQGNTVILKFGPDR